MKNAEAIWLEGTWYSRIIWYRATPLFGQNGQRRTEGLKGETTHILHMKMTAFGRWKPYVWLTEATVYI